jgi:hypothetical protein
MAGKAPGRSQARPKSGIGSMLWLQGMVCGAILTFATPAALLGGTLLAPALIAALADREPGRPVFRAVALFGGAVSLSPLWHLCLSGDSMTTALEILSDPTMLATAWLAAAFGWALCEVLPVLMENGSRLTEAARVSSWKAELKRIEEEWGE